MTHNIEALGLECRINDQIADLRRDVFAEIELLRTSIRTLSDEIEESNNSIKSQFESRIDDLSETVNKLNELRWK